MLSLCSVRKGDRLEGPRRGLSYDIFVSRLLLFTLALLPTLAQEADLDRDKIPDQLEEALLARFRPTFHVSRNDCDSLPSEFQAYSKAPRSIARNGAIYTQAFPHTLPGKAGAFIELHYYHLWANDCGRVSHALDVEHVSALLTAPSADTPESGWAALYWYAAAHEDTPCDAGNGAKAAALEAENRGPDVYIAHGKHSSYLSIELCNLKGCGGDRCTSMAPMPSGKLINLGESAAPLNGALWVHSKAWSLTPKLSTDFTPAVLGMLERLDASGAGPVNRSSAPVKAAYRAGGATIGAVDTGNRHTADALNTADSHTEAALDTATGHTNKALTKSAGKVKSSLRRAAKATADFIRR